VTRPPAWRRGPRRTSARPADREGALAQDAGRQALRGVVGQAPGTAAWAMIGPASRSLVTKCTVPAAHAHAGVQRLLVDVQSREGRQQRRVDVDRPAGPALGEPRAEIRRKPASTTSSTPCCSSLARHGAIEGLASGWPRWETRKWRCRHARRPSGRGRRRRCSPRRRSRQDSRPPWRHGERGHVAARPEIRMPTFSFAIDDRRAR